MMGLEIIKLNEVGLRKTDIKCFLSFVALRF